MSGTLRRVPVLFLALIALALVARPASAQWDGAQFRADAVYATFSFTDPSTGYVTEIVVYADDQSYKEKGDNGPAERISSIDVTISQYDPTCIGGPEQAAAEEPGDPECFYRTLVGRLPTKFSTVGLPDDAFAVSNHQIDAAWLNTPLTVHEGHPDDETGKQQDITISLTWTATSDIYTIHENWLRHTPPEVQTGHINATQRDAVATGTITFDGITYEIQSSYANMGDFQQVTT